MTYSHPTATLPHRSKSEGNLSSSCSSFPSKTMTRHNSRPRPAAPPTLAAPGVTPYSRIEALEQWNALADREEDQPAYGIQNGVTTFLSDQNRRQCVAEWLYKIIDHFQLDRRIVGISFSFIDRYLSITTEISSYPDQRELWLVIVTCLCIAVKLHSNKNDSAIRPILPSLCLSCRFSKELVDEKELEICATLQWYLNPPAPAMYQEIATSIIDSILSDETSIKASLDIRDLSQFLIELSVYDLELSHQKGSSVAHAAILVAMNHYSSNTNSVNKWLSLTLKHESYLTDRCIPRLQALLKAHQRVFRCSSPTNVGGSL